MQRQSDRAKENVMAKGRVDQLVFPVKDLGAAKGLYSKLLGVDPYADSPYYVGFRVDGQEIGLDPQGKGPGPIPYWETADINASIRELVAAGASERDAVRDVGRGLLVASVTDADGNVIGLRQNP
jgi:predicted enzyme related to lactoylglutathione lyase